MSEKNKKRFELSLCEMYRFDNVISFMDKECCLEEECWGHYITIYTHKHEESESEYEDNREYNDAHDENDEYWEMNDIASLHRKVYREMPLNRIKHPFIRNYKKIFKNPNYIQPEIVEIYFINIKIKGNFYPIELAIKKTVWIRIIQRAWKRIYSERCRIIQMIEKNPSLLLKRQQNAKWNIRVPTLYGMLASLKK